MSVFLDTNLLLYAVGIGSVAAKRDIVRDVLASRQCVVSVQVLNEFMFQATKSRRPDRLTFEEAITFTGSLRRLPVVAIDVTLFDVATDVHKRTRYAWWDSLIVAAAITAGCDTLLTEDLQHGRVIDGVRIVNPFRELA